MCATCSDPGFAVPQPEKWGEGVGVGGGGYFLSLHTNDTGHNSSDQPVACVCLPAVTVCPALVTSSCSSPLKSAFPFLCVHRLVGLVVRRPPRERKVPGSNPACAGFFRGRVIPVTSKLALQWLPCQAPGVIGSALGLVGPVSVYCDWVR